MTTNKILDKKKFYDSSKWKHIRLEQLESDHFECQRCKHCDKYSDVPGIKKYTKAVLVHHEYRFLKYPQYALKRFVGENRNLYSLCQKCHEIEHEEERGIVKYAEELNEEKW